MNTQYNYQVESKKKMGSAYSFIFTPTAKEKITEFIPGQHIMLALYDNEGKILGQKPFTICNTPNKFGKIELCIKIYQGFTKRIEELQIEDKVTISQPFGSFAFGTDHNPAVFLAAGSGVTPFISILRNLEEKKLSNEITILYSAKTKEDLMYYDELSNHFSVFSLTGKTPKNWDSETTRIDLKMIKKYCTPVEKNFYYLCGPSVFVQSIKDQLLTADIPENNIFTSS